TLPELSAGCRSLCTAAHIGFAFFRDRAVVRLPLHPPCRIPDGSGVGRDSSPFLARPGSIWPLLSLTGPPTCPRRWIRPRNSEGQPPGMQTPAAVATGVCGYGWGRFRQRL